jgi:hypothetical protein
MPVYRDSRRVHHTHTHTHTTQAVLPTILAGFGETLTADFLSRYCLQKEAAVTDKGNVPHHPSMMIHQFTH